MSRSLLDFVPSVNYDFRLSKKHIFRCKRIFDALDADMIGTIECTHLGTALRACGLNITDKGIFLTMEDQGWEPSTRIDFKTFLIVFARKLRDISTSLGPDYEKEEMMHIKRAFCGLYTDVSAKPPGGHPFTIPKDVLRDRLTKQGPEPLMQQMFERFRVQIPDSCSVDRHYDSVLLFEFLHAGLEEPDDKGADQLKSEHDLAEEKNVHIRTPTRKAAVSHTQEAHTEEAHGVHAGINGQANATAPPKAAQDLHDKGTSLAGIFHSMPSQLAGFTGHLAHAAHDAEKLLGFRSDTDADSGPDFDVIFPDLPHHHADSDATTDSGSLTDGENEKHNGHVRQDDACDEGEVPIQNLPFDQYFIVDETNNKTVAENIAAGKVYTRRRSQSSMKALMSRHGDQMDIFSFQGQTHSDDEVESRSSVEGDAEPSKVGSPAGQGW